MIRGRRRRRNTDVVEKCISVLSIFIAIISTHLMSNLDELSTWNSIPKDHIRVQKKLNISSSLPSPSSDVKVPLLKLTNNSLKRGNKRKLPRWKRSGYRILNAINFLLVSLFDWLNQSRDRVFYPISKHFEESVQNAQLLAAQFFCGVLNVWLKNGKKC